MEVESDWRKKGFLPGRSLLVLPGLPKGPLNDFGAVPICFAIAHELPQEYWSAFAEIEKEGKDGTDQGIAFLQVVEKDRQCLQFTPWHQGHSPREHKEMIDARQQREWQEAKDWRDKKWHLLLVLLTIVASSLFTVLGWFIGSKANTDRPSKPEPSKSSP